MRHLLLLGAVLLLVATPVGALLTPTPSWTPGHPAGTATPTPADCRFEIVPGSQAWSPAFVNSQIGPQSEADLAAGRQAWLNYLWLGFTLDGSAHQEFPAGFVHGITALTPAPPPATQYMLSLVGWNPTSTTKYTVTMSDGFTSYLWHFTPNVSSPNNNSVVFVQEGHSDLVDDEMTGSHFGSVRKAFLDAGYQVIVSWMPVFGPNTGPIPHGDHNPSTWLPWQSSNFHPLSVYVEPIVQVINYLYAHTPPDRIIFTGLSGGGWTTQLVAAIEPRIKWSYEVAGSMPGYIGGGAGFGNCVGGFDHYEQALTAFPGANGTPDNMANYLLAGWGPGRKFRQINNQFDGCCYAGVDNISYVPLLEARAAQLNSNYQHWLDTVLRPPNDLNSGLLTCGSGALECFVTHQYSDTALDVVLSDVQGWRWRDDVEFGFYQDGSWVAHPIDDRGYPTSVRGFAYGYTTMSSSPGTPASWCIGSCSQPTEPLADGFYNVYATYVPLSSNTNGAHYRVFDGTSTLVGESTISQQLAPSGLTKLGANWIPIAQNVPIHSGSATITLQNSTGSPGNTFADAVLLDLVSGVPTPLLTFTSTATRTRTPTVQTPTRTITRTETPTVGQGTPVPISGPNALIGGALVGGAINGPVPTQAPRFSSLFGGGFAGGAFNGPFGPGATATPTVVQHCKTFTPKPPTRTPTPTPIGCPYTFLDHTGDLGASCLFTGTYDALHECANVLVPTDATFFGDGTNVSIIFSTDPTITWMGRASGTTTAVLTRIRLGDGRVVSTSATAILFGRARLQVTPVDVPPPLELCAYSRQCTTDEACLFSQYVGTFDQEIDATHPPPTRTTIPFVHQTGQ